MESEFAHTLEMPPRDVPLSGRIQLTFGGVLSQLGWGFIGFGMIFVWAFSIPQTIGSLFAFSGTLETAQGQIIRSIETNSSENEESIFANRYTFRTRSGRIYSGISYTVGRGAKRGRSITVEYQPGHPERSRVQGMRAQPFSPFILLVLLFPMIGLLVMVGGLRKGIKSNRLLTHGVLGHGELISKQATNAEINDQPVYKLTFEFEADNGRTYQVEEETHKPELLEDEEFERLLYDPREPAKAVMFDSLPGGPEISARGGFEFSLIKGLAALLVPVLTIVGHGLYIIYLFM